MREIGLFDEPANSPVNLKTTANADVVAYRVDVFKADENDVKPAPEKTWFPNTLEADGGSFVLGDGPVYIIVLQAQIRAGGQAAIDPNLSIDDGAGTSDTETIELPQSAGLTQEVFWKIRIG